MWKIKSQNKAIQGMFSGFLIEQAKGDWDSRYQVFGYLQGSENKILLGHYSTFDIAEKIVDAIVWGRDVNGGYPGQSIYIMPRE